MKTQLWNHYLMWLPSMLLTIILLHSSTLYSQNLGIFEPALSVGQNSAKFSKAISNAGDTDHDGFEDIITSAYYFDNGQLNEGKLFLYKGDPETVDNTPDWTFECDQISAQLGFDVVGGRDINNDGYTDILASANLFDNGQIDEGKVFMFLGSSSGFPSTPSWTFESNNATATLGNSIDFAGDINNDGFQDVILGALNFDMAVNEGKVFVFYGNASGLPSTPSWEKFGYASNRYMGTLVAAAGDANGDGYDDVAIVEKISSTTHRIYVFNGGASGLSTTYSWNKDVPQKPTDIKSGDLNNDGYDELVIGCPDHNEGTIYCYSGTALGLSTTLSWKTSGSLYLGKLGFALELEDVTNDGLLDVLATDCIFKEVVPIFDDYYHDAIIIFPGNGVGIDTINFSTIENTSSSTTYGHSLDLADFNGDGYNDLVIGNHESETGTAFGGVIYLVTSSAIGLLGTNHTHFFGLSEDANYGRSVYGGDINGDGFNDMIVSGYKLPLSPVGSSTIIHYGSEALLQDHNTTPQSDSTWQFVDYGDMSYSVGDVNGDGFDDVGVAYQNYTNGQTYEGAFIIYHGGPTGIITTPATIVEGNIEEIYFARELTYGDFNGDGFDDVVTYNYLIDTVFGYYGGPLGVSPTPSWRYPLVGATSICGIGDFNNDGYGDLAIGNSLYNEDVGNVLLFNGSIIGLPSIPSNTFIGNDHTYEIGDYISKTGDINGDGFDDFGSSARLYENENFLEGVFVIFYGSEIGSISNPMIVESNINDMKLGDAFGGAGDVNNDGFNDVLVSQYTPSVTRLYYGSPLGLDTSYYVTFDFYFDAEFLNGIGDVNGDGYDDFVIGDETNTPFGSLFEAGSVLVFYGGLSLSDANYCNLVTGANVIGISPGMADVNWDNSPDINEYVIRWKKLVDTDWLYDTVYLSNCTLTGLEPCATYQYQVRTNCYPFASGWTALDEFASYCTDPCEPVTGLSIDSVNLGNMYISWEAADIGESYIVDYKKSALGVWQTLTVSTTYATLPSLIYCTDYDVTVRTICSEDTSDYSSIITGETFCTACFSPPHDLYATNISTTSAKLNWDADPGAINYKLYYRQLGAAAWSKKNSAVAIKKVTGLMPSTTYEYKVKTECAGGVSTNFSEIATFTTLPLRTEDMPEHIFEVFPNPSNGNFSLFFDDPLTNEVEIVITDLQGQKVATYLIPANTNSTTISIEVATGLYFISCTHNQFHFNQVLNIQ